VLLYGADWCDPCAQAKRHLVARAIPYLYRNVEQAGVGEELALKRRRAGVTENAIPVTEVDGDLLVGWSERRFDALYDGKASQRCVELPVGECASAPVRSPSRLHGTPIHIDVNWSTMQSTSVAAPRHLTRAVADDLREKMVFVAGPRQVGKTVLARQLLAREPGAYFNWDVAEHRRALRAGQLPEPAGLWVFDELHKMRSWRGWLKGVYDLHGDEHPILLTGSAQLDLFRRGGESLQGRYLLHRLHPFTLHELCAPRPRDPERAIAAVEALREAAPPETGDRLEALMRLGGFPEPLLSGSDRRAARWRLGYGARLVREDVRDLESLRDLDKLELLFDRLPALVGSVLSVNALREDLEVAFATARNWLAVFDRLYAIFRLPPLGAPRLKAVRKEQKLYLWDWARVEAEPARFENLVISHLLRLVHFLEDQLGEKAELRYFRDTVGHEVDAVVIRRGRPWLAVETKVADRPLDPGLRYLLERVRIPLAVQVALRGTIDTRPPDVNGCRVRVLPAARFLWHLP
jgi:predicted AAA+ superfamily ATPase/glutaredoxin